METGPRDWGSGATPPGALTDPVLHDVAQALRTIDPDGMKAANAIRTAFDHAYDGRRTGRWDYSQLMKTEKTHLGTLLEIWLQREYGLLDGAHLDFNVAGHDVDCKWSRNLYDWEFPIEMYQDKAGNARPGLAMVVWGNDHTERWALGLTRVDEGCLSSGRNRDRKRKLNPRGRDSILWLHRDKNLLPNTLIRHPSVALEALAQNSGQQAVNTLFRCVQNELVNMSAVEACAQQQDSPKRVRDARKERNLGREGIVIFGHYAPHPEWCETLGLPRPVKGTFVSARLAEWHPAAPENYVTIEGRRWRCARGDDPVVVAPRLPEQGHEFGGQD